MVSSVFAILLSNELITSTSTFKPQAQRNRVMLRGITRHGRLQLLAAAEARAAMTINGTTATLAGPERCDMSDCFELRGFGLPIILCSRHFLGYRILSSLLPVHQASVVAIRATAWSQQRRGYRGYTRRSHDSSPQVSDGSLSQLLNYCCEIRHHVSCLSHVHNSNTVLD